MITRVIITLSSEAQRSEDLNVIRVVMFQLSQDSHAEDVVGVGNEQGHPKTPSSLRQTGEGRESFKITFQTSNN